MVSVDSYVARLREMTDTELAGELSDREFEAALCAEEQRRRVRVRSEDDQ